MSWLTICLTMRNVTVLVEAIFQILPEPRVEPGLLPLTFTCPSADMYGAQIGAPSKLSWAAEIYLDRAVLSRRHKITRHILDRAYWPIHIVWAYTSNDAVRSR